MLPPLKLLSHPLIEHDLATLQKEGIDGADAIIILGSGWGSIADRFKTVAEVGYEHLKSIGTPTAAGHAGKLRLVESTDGKRTLFFLGRRHLYEGCRVARIVAPVVLASRLGVHTVFQTNAAGGLNRDYQIGTLMAIGDHLNLLGKSPLTGAAHFLGLNPCYDPQLTTEICAVANKLQVDHRRGIYLATPGPEYENQATADMFRLFGADAVGMSTVLESIIAIRLAMRLAAASCITNVAGATDLTHDEVQAILKAREKPFGDVIETLLPTLTTAPELATAA